MGNRIFLTGFVCLGLLVFSGCTQEEMDMIICSAENPPIWLQGYCGIKNVKTDKPQNITDKCKSPRQLPSPFGKNDCVCTQNYPLKDGSGECSSFAERKNQGATAEECEQLLAEQKMDLAESCVKVFLTKPENCRKYLGVTLGERCITLLATENKQCEEVVYNAYEKDKCLLNTAKKVTDCDAIKSFLENAKCIANKADKVEDCDKIYAGEVGDWKKMCKQRFGQ